MELKENEKIEDLQFKGLKIIQNKKWFCFGMDAVLLSDFAKGIKKNSVVADLGSGTGIISILLSGKTEAKHIISIEKQPEMADIISRNILLNDLSNKVEVINEDILNLKLNHESVDAVVTNPPYRKKSTGIESENKQKYISKFETTASLNDFVAVSQKILKDKGQFFMVHRPERLADIFTVMRNYKIEPKRVQFVFSHVNGNENAKLVLVEGVKNARPFLRVEKNIFVYNNDGSYTEQIKKIYSCNS